MNELSVDMNSYMFYRSMRLADFLLEEIYRLQCLAILPSDCHDINFFSFHFSTVIRTLE